MSVFIIRRLMQSILVVWIMSLIVFVGVNIVGAPVDMLINPEADQVASFEARGIQEVTSRIEAERTRDRIDLRPSRGGQCTGGVVDGI